MSDLGRKSFTDKASEAIKPDSQKGAFEKAKETVTDGADKLASNITPDNQKSFSQTLGDSAQSGHDQAKDAVDANAKTYSETAAEYVEAGKTKLAETAEYISGVVTGAVEGGKKGGDSK